MGRPVTATKERILAAAMTRFSHYGFRRTSMEDLAAEAGLARASIYLQFQNKEEVFRGLATQLHAEALAGAEAALEKGGTLAARLTSAAEAKSLRFIEIAYGSPHGAELLDESSRLCGGLAAETEERYRKLLARELRRASQEGEIDLASAGLSAPEAADLLTRAMMGLKGPGITLPEYRKRLASLVRIFVAGLGAAPAVKPRTQTAATRR
jgi:AcrR family transcriptional regulator